MDNDKKIIIYTDGACKYNPGPGGYAAIIIYDFEKDLEYIDENKEIFEYNIIDKIVGGEKGTTNNIMELTAIINALDKVYTALNKEENKKILETKKEKNKNLEIIIYSDSNYVVKGINEWIEGWVKKSWKNVKNDLLWRRLYTLKNEIENMENVEIDIRKVKAHNGDKYNEMVDKLASDYAISIME